MNILIFGASIVSGKTDVNGGWVHYLSSYLQKDTINEKGSRGLDVYNLAINGDTSRGLLSRIKTDIKPRVSKHKTVVVVSIGINDSQFNKKLNKNRTPLSQYKTILKGIIDKVKGFNCKVIFIGLTPIDESKTDPIPWSKDRFSYLNSEVFKYNDAMKEIAKKDKAHFVDLLSKLDEKYIKTLEDGVHPSAKGHKMIFEALKDKIK